MKQIDGKEIFTVSEVNHISKETLEQLIFWVEGEVSEFKKHPSFSFYYLKIKDEKSVLPCVADGQAMADFDANIEGKRIMAYGNLTLYEPWGKYQFRIVRIEQYGEGALQKELEELIKKLRAEGLFDKKYKKEIPKYPKRVCIVTSQGSDAWNDFRRHTIDKFPIIELTTADVRVQGPKSINSILKALAAVDEQNFDVIVITRGGGSLEDLAAFNDEQIARAIFEMQTPTVVAIGHEANESLAEWTADVRASTPTDAANIVTAGYSLFLSNLDAIKYRLSSKSAYYFTTNFQKLDHLHLMLQQTKNTFKDLPNKLLLAKESLKRQEKLLISDASEKVDRLISEIQKELQLQLLNQKQKLESANKSLRLLSPENTLSRGYSITTGENGKIIKSVKTLVVGQKIGVQFKDGKVKSKITEKYDKKFD